MYVDMGYESQKYGFFRLLGNFSETPRESLNHDDKLFSGEFKGGRRRKPKSCLSRISKLETIQTVINQLPIYPQVSELEKYPREEWSELRLGASNRNYAISIYGYLELIQS